MFIARRSCIRGVVRGMLRLSDQRYGLIEDRGSLSHVTPHFGSVGQHFGKLPRKFFLGFLVVLVSFADTTNQADFLVFIVSFVDSCIRSALP